MKVFCIILVCLFVSSSANAWDYSDLEIRKIKLNEYEKIRLSSLNRTKEEREWFDSFSKNKYCVENQEIDEKDIPEIVKYLRILGDYLYLHMMIMGTKMNNAITSGNNPNYEIFRINTFDDITTIGENARNYLNEFASDVEKKIIRNGIKDQCFDSSVSKLKLKELAEKIAAEGEALQNGKIFVLNKFKKDFLKKRELAKNDVVAQVLNYSAGIPEDASDNNFFYPEDIENGRCIYKVAVNKGTMEDIQSKQMLEAGKFISSLGLSGTSEINQTVSAIEKGIDLNKADLKNVSFYQLKGAKNNSVAYLRYQTRVEGLPDLFECDSNSCNIDRLKRGWALVRTKCKGTQKAF